MHYLDSNLHDSAGRRVIWIAEFIRQAQRLEQYRGEKAARDCRCVTVLGDSSGWLWAAGAWCAARSCESVHPTHRSTTRNSPAVRLLFVFPTHCGTAKSQ